MTSITQLQQHRQIWRASDPQAASQARLASGFANLDTLLGGGFPQAGLVRIRSLPGVGELTLLQQLMRHNPQQKLLMFINAPGMITEAWLQQLELDPHQIICTRPATSEDALWAAEQCVKSEACYLVILWHNQVTPKQARRLQVAASQHHVLCVLYEASQAARVALPVALDLSLYSARHGLQVEIAKQVGGWPGQHTEVALPYTPHNTTITRLMQGAAPAPSDAVAG